MDLSVATTIGYGFTSQLISLCCQIGTCEGALLSHGIVQLRMKRGGGMLYLREKVGHVQNWLLG